jgi:uncharacterized protein
VISPPRSDNRLLRLNVGFLLKEGPGYTREFSFDQAGVFVIEDVAISQLNGALRLTRTRQGIVIQGTLRACTQTECVRCLTPFNLSCDMEFSELFVYPAPAEPGLYDFYVVDEGGFIDLQPIIREEGILAIPIQALCSLECKGLCSQCGQNLNEKMCDCSQDREGLDETISPLHVLLDDSA